MPSSPRPWVMYAIIALNVAAFAVELAKGARLIVPSKALLIELGASVPRLTHDGEPWRLLTSMVLHANVLHLATMLLCVYSSMVVLEVVYGPLGVFAIYVTSGVAGGLASMALGPSDAITIGASAAIFGALGAWGAFLVVHRHVIEVPWRPLAWALAKKIAFNAVLAIALPHVSLFALLGGLGAGFLAGAFVLGRLDTFLPQRTVRALAVLMIGIVACAFVPARLPERRDAATEMRRFRETQHALVERWHAAEADIESFELADYLAAQVLPPYREALDRLRALDDVPDKLQRRFNDLEAYAAAQIAELEAEHAVASSVLDDKTAVVGRALAAHDEAERLREISEASAAPDR